MKIKHERIRWRRPIDGYRNERNVTLAGAILGSAAIGAGGSLFGSYLQSKQAANSIQAQQQMFQQGEQIQQSEYNQGLETLLQQYGIGRDAQGNYVTQGVSQLAPFTAEAGAVAPTLNALLTPGPDMTKTLEQIPGFKFAQQYGQKAITNQFTMRGLGGNVGTAGADYATGAATQSYSTIVDQLRQLYGLGAGAGGMAGQILGSAGNTAVSAGANVGGSALSGSVNAGNSLLQGGITAGSNIGGAMNTLGTTQAAGALGVGNAAQGGTSALTNIALLNALKGGGNINLSQGLFGQQQPTGA